MSAQPSIGLQEVYEDIKRELDDLYSDGIISTAIYNKKQTKRLSVYAISRADRHICLDVKLTAHVAIFVPKGQRTIFFRRQGEYLSNWRESHSDIQVRDARQFSLLFQDQAFLDVISVIDEQAQAYSDLPIDDARAAGTVLSHGLPNEVKNGNPDTARRGGRRFFVEPNERKMILSDSFDSDMWLRFEAQIAPVKVNLIGTSKKELDCYPIRAPYWAQNWLLMRAMTRILSGNAAQAAGYFELEAKAKSEAYQNRPGTGNVIISGDELDGNYEGDLSIP